MTRPLLLASLTICLLANSAHAERSWTSIPIPGAACGDGGQYSVMMSFGDPGKIAFDLMGGGACWNFQTCFGPTPLTNLHPVESVPEFEGFVSDDPAKSPAASYTMVYFPYCTGDAHIGDHDATYAGIAKVHHWGKRNFEAAVRYIQDTGRVNLTAAESFIMYGYSAGAIASLVHLATVAPYLEHAKSKVLLADAPGLHFGNSFWKKFPPEYLQDFAQAMSRAGVRLDVDQGNIAAVVPSVCRIHSDWRIGVLQGSRDWIMSVVFGNISANEHEKLVYSAAGVYGLTLDPKDNCATWAPASSQHTFLVSESMSKVEASGKSAMDFAFDTILGNGGPNYR